MKSSLPQDATCIREGIRFDLYRVDVPGSDGRPHPREFIHTPGSVVILPLLDDDTVVLIQNRRPAVDRVLWELPAGTLEPGEDPAVCAARELIEETGYQAAELTELTKFYPSPGVSDEWMVAYRANGLTHVGQNLDESEQITVHPVSRAQALQMVRQGDLIDAKSIALLLFDQVFTQTREM